MPALNARYLSRPELEHLGFSALGINVRIHPSVVIVDPAGINKIGDLVRIDTLVVLSAHRLLIGSRVHISAHVCRDALAMEVSLAAGDIIKRAS